MAAHALLARVKAAKGGGKSSCASPCKRLWEIAEEMRLANPLCPRKEILARAESEGIHPLTARTQFQAWKKASEGKALTS